MKVDTLGIVFRKPWPGLSSNVNNDLELRLTFATLAAHTENFFINCNTHSSRSTNFRLSLIDTKITSFQNQQ